MAVFKISLPKIVCPNRYPSFEFGLLENRSGSRLLALPQPLLEALYNTLEDELGEGSSVALFSIGRWWGKNFYQRLMNV